MRKLLFTFGALLVVLLVAGGITIFNQDNQEVIFDTYTNEEYGFSLERPTDWVVFEATNDPLGPKINIYKSGRRDGQLPLDHFANATHVSIYPQGIATEGIISLNRELSETPTSFETQHAIEFIQEDATPFALYLNPNIPPENWDEAGFIWARAYMPDLKTECRRGDEVVEDIQNCESEKGDTIVYSGTLDADEWRTIEHIIGSITFLNTLGGGATTTHDLITIETPKERAVIESPLTLSGDARGQWYFEASFPVVLTNWDGLIIAEGFVTAENDWMTTDFVPFKGMLEFESPFKDGDPDFMKNGTLIFKKDNPSGLPENDAAYEIPIRFAE
jgi:hypothetical protein